MKNVKTISLFAALALLIFNACNDDSNPTSSSSDNQTNVGEVDEIDDSSLPSDSALIFNPQALISQLDILSTIFSPEVFQTDGNSDISEANVTTEAIQSGFASQDIAIPDTLIAQIVENPEFVALVLDASVNGEPDEMSVQTFVFANLSLFMELTEYLPTDTDIPSDIIESIESDTTTNL